MKQPNLFPYFGGKYRLASKLIPMFPEHQCYVEVFGGAGNVLIQKHPSKVEVFNDINSDVVNLFRVLRNDFDEFHRQVTLTPHSREEIALNRKSRKTETDPLKRAVMWYSVICQSFAGKHDGGWAFSKQTDRAKAFKNKVDRLPLIVDRLREVLIENKDFQFILDSYDGKDTLFYLDPPYVPETRRDGGYENEMTTQEHATLISILSDIQGQVMLSGYQHEIYDTLGWQRYEIKTVATSAGATRVSGLQGEGNVSKNQKRVESVYMNYDLESEVSLWTKTQGKI